MKDCFRIGKYLQAYLQREQLQIVSVLSNILDRAERIKNENTTSEEEVITIYFSTLSSKHMEVRVSLRKIVL